MKDNVENRKRVSFARKLRIARLMLQENGPLWCIWMLTYYFASTIAHKAFTVMDRMRRARGIPGLNSRRLNKEIWEAWNWSADGEEFTLSQEWKESLTRCVLEREIPEGGRVLEIGPGGGRWTEPLLARAHEYIGVDISAACVEHCRHRFGSNPRAQFVVGSGNDLAMLADDSVDALWSFDVFVHINDAEVDRYASEFQRVLRKGGVGVIHHGSVGGTTGGWRSNVTRDGFKEIIERHGLRTQRALNYWLDGDRVHPMAYDDVMTVFAKP